jgi:hypothetical protein
MGLHPEGVARILARILRGLCQSLRTNLADTISTASIQFIIRLSFQTSTQFNEADESVVTLAT